MPACLRPCVPVCLCACVSVCLFVYLVAVCQCACVVCPCAAVRCVRCVQCGHARRCCRQAVPLICPVLLRGLTIACVVRPAASADGARQCYAPVAVLASAFFLSDCARALCDALEGRLRVRLVELSEHEEAAYFSVTSLKLACRTLVSVRQFDMHLSQLLCLLPCGVTPPTAAAGKPASPLAARRPEASAVQPALPTARRLEVGAVQPPPATSRPETGAVQPPPAKAMKAESVTPIVVTPVHRTTRRRDNGAVICID